MEKRPLIVLTGPTAVGKTSASIGLAKAVGGEIISADSMQVYRKMNIGSAKIAKEEMDGIPHYLIDVLDPAEEFNVVRFQKMAKEAMKQIYANGHIPIIVGGTGFYVQALLYDIDFTAETEDHSIRDELEVFAAEHGVEELHRMLQEIDPKSAMTIHANNKKRVIRAIEYYRQTGRPISEHNEKERQKESPYHFVYFVLMDEREHLYDRIEKRIDLMLEEGLLEEVKALRNEGYTKDMVSMQGLGYKELLDYLNGDSTLEEAIYILKRDTRHFAKRQITWFKREKEVIWIHKNEFGYDENKMLKEMLNILKEKEILDNGLIDKNGCTL